MTEDRLTELEVKISFQDDLLDALNLTVSRQQQQIDQLQQHIKLIFQHLQSSSQAESSLTQQEPPPHY